MRWDDLPESGNVEDRRGEGGGGGGGGGFGGMPDRRRRARRSAPIVVLGLIGWALGIDPSLLIGGAEILTGGDQPQRTSSAAAAARRTGAPQRRHGPLRRRACSAAPRCSGRTSSPRTARPIGAPTLVHVPRRDRRAPAAASRRAPWGRSIARTTRRSISTPRSSTRSRRASAAASGSKACQFAQAYVIAHEVGHHVQNLLGILPQAQQAQRAAGSKAEANHIQVQVELQADCFAGVWANRENDRCSAGQAAFIEPGDVEAALQTAAAIGDDTLQQQRAGLCGARQLHPRHVRAAPALVQHRLQGGHDRKLQHLRRAQL